MHYCRIIKYIAFLQYILSDLTDSFITMYTTKALDFQKHMALLSPVNTRRYARL